MFDLHHLLIRMFTHHCPVCCSELEALGSWHKQRIHYFLEKICTFVLYYHKMSQYQSIYMLHEVLICMVFFKSTICVHDKCMVCTLSKFYCTCCWRMLCWHRYNVCHLLWLSVERFLETFFIMHNSICHHLILHCDILSSPIIIFSTSWCYG